MMTPHLPRLMILKVRFPTSRFHTSADISTLDEGQTHLLELSKLAEKDPEFFKYLQENDRELLEFNPGATDQDEDMADVESEEEEEKMPVLTGGHIRQWQKALLEVRYFCYSVFAHGPGLVN